MILIIADDFTGALDTSCCFAKCGFRTWLLPADSGTIALGLNPEVLVFASGTRHMLPGEAYAVTARIIDLWKDYADCIFLKTDSAWRGNISATAAAAVRVTGKTLHAMPAYPQIHRTLQDGVIYIGDQLLEQSVFAKDPRSPMTVSNGTDLLRMDYPLQVRKVPENGETISIDRDQELPEVYLYDCTSEESMEKTVRERIREGCSLISGCAGLGTVYAQLRAEAKGWKGDSRYTEKTAAQGGFLIFSGSANPITFAQLAERGDIPLFRLETAEEALPVLKTGGTAIVAAAEREEDIRRDAPDSYHQELMNRMQTAAADLIRNSGCRDLAVFGGDTLEGILTSLDWGRIHVTGQLEDGVSICLADTSCGRIRIFAKSGGLGSRQVIRKMEEYRR
ncbi:MAG: four-carbon acid sugar kinase family protein [Firmicutes bacterium]|nr:four-carbon acid sugar kinase family protein [Bacillota bacterium]